MTTATWRRSDKAEVVIGKVTGDTKLTNALTMLYQTRAKGLVGRVRPSYTRNRGRGGSSKQSTRVQRCSGN